MNKTALNIKNLTSLWKLAGKTANGFYSNENIFWSQIENAEWPNRIWTDKPLNEKDIQVIKEKMENDKKLTFSHFHEQESKSPLHAHFTLKSVQYGMSLPLKDKFETKKNIDFIKVNNKDNAELWSASFYKSFKYNISAETILKTKNDIQYFLVYKKNELIATIVLYVTDKIAGIHSLGVIPAKRKQGFASEIMFHILNKAIDEKLNVATLQASEMAKEMYLKMGFSINFIMENYKLNHKIMNYTENQNWRYATKKFDTNKKVSNKDLDFIKKTIQLSVSSYGLQLYKILIIEDKSIREKLQLASWNQSQITDASHLFIFCNYTEEISDGIDEFIDLTADTRSIDKKNLIGYSDFMKAKISEKSTQEQFNWTKNQTYIALANLLSACAELKIDACPMEGFESKQYNEILGLNTKGLNASVIATIGYRSKDDDTQYLKKVRKPLEKLFENI